MPSEYDIQISLQEWMIAQHPTVLMHCDLSGVRLPIGYAVKIKKLNPNGRAYPDIFLPEPRGKYHGLFIELKRCYADLLTKKGAYKKGRHIEEQRHILQLLQQKGYRAAFACGFDDTQNLINDYLDRENKE